MEITKDSELNNKLNDAGASDSRVLPSSTVVIPIAHDGAHLARHPQPNPFHLPIDDSLGVAFSGGGIRSASFCSGVLSEIIQHVEQERQRSSSSSSSSPSSSSSSPARPFALFPRFLSSVSGGGYTASSWISWMRAAADKPTRFHSMTELRDKYIKNMSCNIGYYVRDSCFWGVFDVFSLLFIVLSCFALAIITLLPFPVLIADALAFLFDTCLISNGACHWNDYSRYWYGGTFLVVGFGMRVLLLLISACCLRDLERNEFVHDTPRSSSSSRGSDSGSSRRSSSSSSSGSGSSGGNSGKSDAEDKDKDDYRRVHLNREAWLAVISVFRWLGTFCFILGMLLTAVTLQGALTPTSATVEQSVIVASLAAIILLLITTSAFGLVSLGLSFGLVVLFWSWILLWRVQGKLWEVSVQSFSSNSTLPFASSSSSPSPPQLLGVNYSDSEWQRLLLLSYVLAFMFPYTNALKDCLLAAYSEMCLRTAFYYYDGVERDLDDIEIEDEEKKKTCLRGMKKWANAQWWKLFLSNEFLVRHDHDYSKNHSHNNENNDSGKSVICSSDAHLPIYISCTTVNLWRANGQCRSYSHLALHSDVRYGWHLYVDAVRGETEQLRERRRVRDLYEAWTRSGENVRGGTYRVVSHVAREEVKNGGRDAIVNCDMPLSRAMSLSAAAIAQSMGDYGSCSNAWYARHASKLSGISMGQWIRTYSHPSFTAFIVYGVQLLELGLVLFVFTPITGSDSSSVNASGVTYTQEVARSILILLVLLVIILQPLIHQLWPRCCCVSVNSVSPLDFVPFVRSMRMIGQDFWQSAWYQADREKNKYKNINKKGNDNDHTKIDDATTKVIGEPAWIINAPPYLYITDGGHTENNGMLPLLQKRLKYIVVADGSEDGSLGCAAFLDGLQYASSCFGCQFYPLSAASSSSSSSSSPSPSSSSVDCFDDVNDDDDRFRSPRDLEHDLLRFAADRRRRCFMLRVRYDLLDDDDEEEKKNKRGYLFYLKPIDTERDAVLDAHLDHDVPAPVNVFGCCCDCCSTSWYARLTCTTSIWNGLLGAFPHVTTALQFFNKVAFEKYHQQGKMAMQEVHRFGNTS